MTGPFCPCPPFMYSKCMCSLWLPVTGQAWLNSAHLLCTSSVSQEDEPTGELRESRPDEPPLRPLLLPLEIWFTGRERSIGLSHRISLLLRYIGDFIYLAYNVHLYRCVSDTVAAGVLHVLHALWQDITIQFNLNRSELLFSVWGLSVVGRAAHIWRLCGYWSSPDTFPSLGVLESWTVGHIRCWKWNHDLRIETFWPSSPQNTVSWLQRNKVVMVRSLS